MFRPVESRRSFAEALEQIVEAIVTGQLRVGDRMPSEREMARAMGISRPTLREALKILNEAGVIEVKPGSRGTYVRSDFVPRDIVNQRRSVLLEGVGSVLQARRVVEMQVAQIAGGAATEEDFYALRATVGLQRKHSEDHDRLLQLDERFHLELARAAHNPTLLEFVRLILRRSAVARDMTPRAPEDPERELEIHERTLDALESRDPTAIEKAMDEHMSYLENIWAEETGQLLPRLPRPSRASVSRV